MYIDIIEKILVAWADKDFREWVEDMGRQSRSGRLALALRRKKKPEKPELFFRVFDRRYTSARDYLLRNELTILRRKLEQRLTQDMSIPFRNDAPYFASFGMALWCMRHQLNEEAFHYAEKAMKQADEAGDHAALLRIIKVTLQLSQLSKTMHDEREEYIRMLAEKHHRALQQLVAEEVRFADFVEAARGQLSAQLRRSHTDFTLTEQVKFDIASASSPVAEYYRCKALGFASSGREAVQHFRDALRALGNAWEEWAHRQEWFACSSAIARELSVAGEWTEAEVVFREMLERPDVELYPGRRSLQINYCTTLVKQKKYKTAIDLLESIETEELEPVVEERLFTLKTICYVFYEDPVRIRSILPHDLGPYDLSLKIYYRLLYTMYYLVKQDWEMAEREISNIASTRGLEETSYSPLVGLFRKYIRLIGSLPPGGRPEGRKRRDMQKAFDKVVAEHAQVVNMLPGLWLTEKWNELVQNGSE